MNKINYLLRSKNTIFVLNIAFIFFYYIYNYNYFLLFAVLISIISLISDKLSIYIDRIWYKFSELLGLFIPNILLTFIYFFILYPIAFFQKKLSKEDPLFLKNKSISTFKLKNKNYYRKDFENIW
jgi:hypothetical protein